MTPGALAAAAAAAVAVSTACDRSQPPAAAFATAAVQLTPGEDNNSER